ATFDPLTAEDTFNILKSIVDAEQLTQVMNKEEIDFSYTFNQTTRLRSTAYVQQGMVNLTFRVIQEVQGFEELHLPDILKAFTEKEQGLFLVVGPVGQGKSTTMAAMVDMINENRKEHIVTIENP